MLRYLVAIAAAVLFGAAAPVSAGVVITVDKTTQHLSVSVNGAPRYSWPVSTARDGYNTPNGSYRPERLERQWYSGRYGGSPMPYSIFFSGGYAIHGSSEISRLGRPASHGCIRLHPGAAATLFALVHANQNDARIIITGRGEPLIASRGSRTRYSNVEDYDRRNTSAGRVNHESHEARPPRGYELRRGRNASPDDFDEPRGSRKRYSNVEDYDTRNTSAGRLTHESQETRPARGYDPRRGRNAAPDNFDEPRGSRTRYSNVEDHDTRSNSSRRATREGDETRPPRSYEVRGDRNAFPDNFDEPRGRR